MQLSLSQTSKAAAHCIQTQPQRPVVRLRAFSSGIAGQPTSGPESPQVLRGVQTQGAAMPMGPLESRAPQHSSLWDRVMLAFSHEQADEDGLDGFEMPSGIEQPQRHGTGYTSHLFERVALEDPRKR